MWDKIKEWFKRNKSYLTALFLGSVIIGGSVALLAFFCPPVLAAFAGISIFGVAPLAFLTALSVPLAAIVLGGIITGIAFGAILGGMVVWKQLISIGKHVYSYFENNSNLDLPVMDEQQTYHYLMNHLEAEHSESFDEDDDESYDYSSDSPEEVKSTLWTIFKDSYPHSTTKIQREDPESQLRRIR
ncbi:hypothetical protein EP47_03760 [Legionella norrlandica]|uniref:Uncharacterized protein n=1 Tax=Legionella norrlandica TaxID=1498499 RepID=A0A0A2T9F4_9GAMM|nr:hypothetical protein [Legionella norrlandica]KGP64048.1 hypothetical protein EP47_03760 [Legionella norrlandica]